MGKLNLNLRGSRVTKSAPLPQDILSGERLLAAPSRLCGSLCSVLAGTTLSRAQERCAGPALLMCCPLPWLRKQLLLTQWCRVSGLRATPYTHSRTQHRCSGELCLMRAFLNTFICTTSDHGRNSSSWAHFYSNKQHQEMLQHISQGHCYLHFK